MTIDEIRSEFASQWILIEDPETDDALEVLGGRVIYHSSDRDEVYRKAVALRPKTFEIDCVVNSDAIEIKWRDATTDGDHITKEHTRLQAVKKAGFHPIRVMFYYPNREQAIRIQKTLQTLYKGLDGEYHFGDAAWDFVKERTGVDLLTILQQLAEENTENNAN